jgi:hypothetical protein
MKLEYFEVVEKPDGKIRLIVDQDVDGISTIGFLFPKKELYSLYVLLRDLYKEEENADEN